MCLDQVKRRPTIYADMPVFHVFAVRALFPRVLTMCLRARLCRHACFPCFCYLGTISTCFDCVLGYQACLGQVKWRPAVLAQYARFPCCRYSGTISTRFDHALGSRMCSDQVKRYTAIFPDMPFFHGIAVRALFPCVLAVFQVHERVRVKLCDTLTFFLNLPVFHVLNVHVLFSYVSTVSHGSERVRV
jgi:hypothetical protein